MVKKVSYPVLSIFVENALSQAEEYKEDTAEGVLDTLDAELSLAAYERISGETREKCLDFAHELIKYFTPNLLLHHFQDEVPIFSFYVGVSEEGVNINTQGGYYSRFIKHISSVQNMLDDILISIKENLNFRKENVDDIIMELQDLPRLDIKEEASKDDDSTDERDVYLDWTFTRVVRTPYSEVYVLYLDEENAGEVHIHIGKDINATIITTIEITEREKAQLMGHLHEMLLESLEEEHETNSTISFFSDAIEVI